MIKSLLAIASLSLLPTLSFATTSADELPCESPENNCTFVLLKPNGELVTHNTAQANKRLSPYSTFKIPNSLIALDTGAARSLEETFTSDTNTYPPESWWPSIWTAQSHNLPSAYKYSVVPIYRELAVKIGEKAMQEYVTAFNYGNQDISSGLDSFWLGSSIEITAVEQVKFLQKLFTQKLPLKASTYAQLETLMFNDKGDDFTVFAKTGAGPIGNKTTVGWFVGAVEKDGEHYYFASNVTGKVFRKVTKARIENAKRYLAHYDIAYTK